MKKTHLLLLISTMLLIVLIMAFIVTPSVMRLLAIVTANPIHVYPAQGTAEVEVWIDLFLCFKDSEPEWAQIKDAVVAAEQAMYEINPNLYGGKYWFLGKYYMSFIVSVPGEATISVNAYDSYNRLVSTGQKTASMSAYFYGPLAGSSWGFTVNPDAQVMTGASFVVSTTAKTIQIYLSTSGSINFQGSTSASMYVYFTTPTPPPEPEVNLPYEPPPTPTPTPTVPPTQPTPTPTPTPAPQPPPQPPPDTPQPPPLIEEDDWVPADPVPVPVRSEGWIEIKPAFAEGEHFVMLLGFIVVGVTAVYMVKKRKSD